MNRRLFLSVNIKRQYIICLVALLAICITGRLVYQVFYNRPNTFLKFHGQSRYTPLNKDNQGFYGKANDMLKRALLERTAEPYDISKLDKMYARLKFFYPADTTDYLVSPDDIRLIGLIPSKSDREFYFDSYLSNVLAAQKKDLTAKFFDIQWDRGHHQITNIKIDSTLFNLSLQSNNWKGTVLFNDPFYQIQPSIKYLIFNNRFVPLFKSNLDETIFYNAESEPVKIYPLDNHIYTKEDYESFYSDLNNSQPAQSKAYLLIYNADNQAAESSVRILNTGKNIILKTLDVDLVVSGSGVPIRTVHDTSIRLPSKADMLKLQIRQRGRKQVYTAYISNKSIFSIASKPKNDGNTSARLHTDTSLLDLFSAQELQQFESGISSADHVNTVSLSTNLLLAKYLENKIKEKINQLYRDSSKTRRSDDEYDMSMCLMDISTGEIIAAPFYSNTFPKNNENELTYQRNFNLIRHNIGSTFKPLLSFAACLKYPSLSHFSLLPADTKFINDTLCQILNYHTLAYGLNKDKTPKIAPFWSEQAVDRTHFLAVSHDNYPVAMAMLALTEKNDVRAYNLLSGNEINNEETNNLHDLNGPQSTRIIAREARGKILFQNISHSSFINEIANLYDVKSNIEDSTSNIITYDTNILRGLKTSKQLFFTLYPDITRLGTEYFGNANSNNADFRKFELFILGEGDNLWSNVKLAEAYSRLLSKHRIKASLLKCDSVNKEELLNRPDSLFNSSSDQHYHFNINKTTMDSSWKSLMTDWRAAVQMQTNTPLLRPAFDHFSGSLENSKDYYFYCKTGTPQAFEDHKNDKVFKKGHDNIWWNEGLFVFGITNKDPRYPKGIVGVIYIKHLSLDKTESVNSGVARDFLTPDVFKQIMFYNLNRFKN